MKIALIGVPGAGKTKLANVLKKELSLKVVDNYVSKLEKDIGFSLGYNAGYMLNVLIAAKRWELECKAGEDRVTCGTIVETACYVATWATDIGEHVTQDDYVLDRMYARTTMDLTTLFYLDTFKYDKVFYLPLTKVGLKKSVDPELDARLDYSIRDSLAMMNVDFITLNHIDQAAQALEAINETDQTD